MKPIFIVLALVTGVSFFSCKKNNDDAPVTKTILLSHSYTNGHLANRFYYSPSNKLTRFDGYNEQSPNTLTASIVIEYDQSDNIIRLTTYQEPGHTATNRTIIDSQQNGNIIATSNYDLQSATPNSPNSSQKRTYNAQGRLSKLELRDKNGKLIHYSNVLYYADGSVKQVDTYKEESNQLYLVEKRVYAIPGGHVPKGLEALDPILGFDYTALFFNDAYQYTTYDQNGGISFNRQYLFSAREYSADSTLTRQTITIKNIKPAGTDNITYKQYEYITQ